MWKMLPLLGRQQTTQMQTPNQTKQRNKRMSHLQTPTRSNHLREQKNRNQSEMLNKKQRESKLQRMPVQQRRTTNNQREILKNG